jgi:hypothetical protein
VPKHRLRRTCPSAIGEETAYERSDRFADVLERDRAGIVGERRSEELDVIRHAGEHTDDRLLVLHPHIRRTCDLAYRLRFDVDGAAVPELRDLRGGVEDARSIPTGANTAQANRGRLRVGTKPRQHMTCAARNFAIPREPRVME